MEDREHTKGQKLLLEGRMESQFWELIETLAFVWLVGCLETGGGWSHWHSLLGLASRNVQLYLYLIKPDSLHPTKLPN